MSTYIYQPQSNGGKVMKMTRGEGFCGVQMLAERLNELYTWAGCEPPGLMSIIGYWTGVAVAVLVMMVGVLREMA
ncbi:unnamed protein product [Cylicocyclus nassatus]|uniref:Uncharacterized protein n=1 Tax=Cylicocyclus nassatus TaxID=53992 RepID=A0AA36GHD0_CYLNA|nr:unnamed protein product [Cylicocyclus nassatus]